MSTDPEDGFLTRWSRRKRSARPEDEPPPADAAPPPVPAETPPAEDDRPDEAILAELGLPDPDTLGQGADFSVFMRAAVPERIRRRALRRLWRSNPVLAVLDGLNDYDGDFTGDTVAPGMLKTAYQVGKGIVREVVVPEEAPEAETRAPEQVAALETGGENSPGSTERDDPAGIGDEAEAAGETAEIGENGAVRTRKRMSFRFEG